MVQHQIRKRGSALYSRGNILNPLNRRTVLWLLAIAAVVAAAVSAYWCSWQADSALHGRSQQELGLMPKDNHYFGPIISRERFLQAIAVEHPLNGLSVFFSTFQKPQVSPYDLVVFGPDKAELRRIPIGTDVVDNAFRRIDFPAIAPPAGKQLYFTIEPSEASVAAGLAVQLSAPNLYPQGLLEVDGHPVAEDIVFVPFFDMQAGRAELILTLRFWGKKQAYAAVVLAVMLTIYLYPRLKAYAIVPSYILLSLFYAGLHMPFYDVDEGAHATYAFVLADGSGLPKTTDVFPCVYLDTIKRAVGVVRNGCLDNIPFYEAVQPPLYYVFMAAVIKLSTILLHAGTTICFYFMRFVGVFLVASGLALLIKTYGTIQRHAAPTDLSSSTFLVFLSTLICSPTFFLANTAVTNDQLTFFLSQALTFMLVKAYASGNLSWRSTFCLGLLVGGLWMTKISTVFLLVPSVFLVTLCGGWRKALLVCGTVAAFVSPWYAWNWRYYHAPTGMQPHIDFVRKIINPNNVQLKWDDLLVRGPHTFWLDFFRSGNAPQLCDTVALVVGCTFLCGMVAVGLQIACGLAAYVRQPSLKPSVFLIPAGINLYCVTAPFVLACALSLETNLWFVLPRYMFMNAGPVLYCLAQGHRAIFATPAQAITKIIFPAAAILSLAYTIANECPVS